MKKNVGRGIAVLVILLVVFSVISFVIPFEKTTVFWIAYLCGVVATLLQAYFFRSAFGGSESAKSKFYGFPIARVGVIYLAVQMIVSLAEIALARFLPVWTVIILNVLILAAALIGCITVEAARDEVVRQDTNRKVAVSSMRELQSVSAALADQCTNPEMKKTITQLAEELRYSDPVTSEKTKDYEARMKEMLEKLQQLVRAGQTEEGKKLCSQLLVLLKERNRACSLNKQ